MEKENPTKIIKYMGLVKNRHVIPQAVDGFIFEYIPNPANLPDIINRLYKSLEDVYMDKLVLYVTGLSVALVEVINYCMMCDIELVLMHYNAKTKGYFRQTVFIGGSYKIVREQMHEMAEESKGE